MSLPQPDLTPAEAADVVAVFGTGADYVAWFAPVLRDELERRITADARETANATMREAVEAAVAELPAALNPAPASE